MVGTCYTMSKESFQDCVNQFKFSEQVIKELLLKHNQYKERVLQTQVFQKNFLMMQHEQVAQMQAWAKRQQ